MNVIESINKILEGIQVAYSRGAYTMQETHELYVAAEVIKQASVSQEQKQKEQEKKEGDDY